MDIRNITVNGLFKTFDHKIDFSNGDIKIIIGENGIGKTAVLRILDAVFNKNHQALYSIVFDSITIDFATKSEKWTITKETDKNDNLIRIQSNLHKKDDQIIHVITKNALPRRIFMKIGDNEWFDRHLDVGMSREDILNRYGIDMTNDSSNNEKEWYSHRLSENQIKLINAQRLFQQKKEGRDDNSFQETVSVYSQALVDILKKNDTDFSTTSQKLDGSFANRLLKALNKNKKSKSNPDFDGILNKLTVLSDYRSKLSKVGVIAQEKDEVIQNLDFIDSNIITVLSLYVDDNTEKLECYKETAEKLDILLNIINHRFKHKKIVVDKSKGFVVKTTLFQEKNDEEGIAVNRLSSGEQNELIMFYDLLFNCDSKDLVLIDEPEISLHLKWQQSLIEDLRSICKTNNISLLIATHSPDIIGDNWNLVQTLSGKE